MGGGGRKENFLFSFFYQQAEYKQFENTDMGQALHLHNYIVNGQDNENRQQKNIK